MKRIGIVLVCAAALMGCERVEVAQARYEEQQKEYINNISSRVKYGKDERADVCYAFVRNLIVVVPCEKVNHLINKQGTK